MNYFHIKMEVQDIYTDWQEGLEKMHDDEKILQSLSHF